MHIGTKKNGYIEIDCGVSRWIIQIHMDEIDNFKVEMICPEYDDGRHRFITRKHIWPTGRKRSWMILVDSCRCGVIVSIFT